MNIRCIYAILLWILMVGCIDRDNELIVYLKSRDTDDDRRVKVYLDNTRIIDMDLAENSIEENYNVYRFNLNDKQKRLIKVVLEDSLSEEIQLPDLGSYELFIIVNSTQIRRDYNNFKIQEHLRNTGTSDFRGFADSLYDNGIIEEKYIQLPKDSIIEIDFRKLEALSGARL